MIGCRSDAGDRSDGCKQEVAGAAGQDKVLAVDRKQCFSGDRSPARRADLHPERRLEGPNWRLCLFWILTPE